MCAWLEYHKNDAGSFSVFKYCPVLTKRNEGSSEKCLIPGLGREVQRSLEYFVAHKVKTCLKVSRSQFEGATSAQIWDKMSIKIKS